jgi:hypothetical protein
LISVSFDDLMIAYREDVTAASATASRHRLFRHFD